MEFIYYLEVAFLQSIDPLLVKKQRYMQRIPLEMPFDFLPATPLGAYIMNQPHKDPLLSIPGCYLPQPDLAGTDAEGCQSKCLYRITQS